MFVVIGMENDELVSLELFGERDQAEPVFESLLEHYALSEWPNPQLTNEVKDTLRFAADSVYAIHLIEVVPK